MDIKNLVVRESELFNQNESWKKLFESIVSEVAIDVNNILRVNDFPEEFQFEIIPSTSGQTANKIPEDFPLSEGEYEVVSDGGFIETGSKIAFIPKDKNIHVWGKTDRCILKRLNFSPDGMQTKLKHSLRDSMFDITSIKGFFTALCLYKGSLTDAIFTYQERYIKFKRYINLKNCWKVNDHRFYLGTECFAKQGKFDDRIKVDDKMYRVLSYNNGYAEVEEIAVPMLKVDPHYYLLDGREEERIVKVTSTVPWDVENFCPWLSIIEKGDDYIKFRVLLNFPRGVERKTTLVFYGEDVYDDFCHIAQIIFDPHLVVDPHSIQFGESGGTARIAVDANLLWLVDFDMGDIIEMGDDYIIIAVASQFYAGTYTGRAYFYWNRYPEVANDTSQITQIVPPKFTVSPTSDSIGVDGGNKNISVTHNLREGWSARINNDWISERSKSDNSYAISIGKNEGTSERTGTITFTPNYPGVSAVTYKITQEALVLEFSINPTSIRIPKDGKTGNTINVIHNLPGGWSYKNAPDWCKNITVSGDTLSFDVDKNEETTEKTGSITFYATAGEVPTEPVCSIVQEGGEAPELTIDIADYGSEIPIEGAEIDLDVTTNDTAGFTVESEQSWATVTKNPDGTSVHIKIDPAE